MPHTKPPYTAQRAALPVAGKYDWMLIGPNGEVILQVWAPSPGGPALDPEATAKFLAQAANAHEALVAALQKVRECLEGIDLTDYPVSNEIEVVDAALKLAGAA